MNLPATPPADHEALPTDPAALADQARRVAFRVFPYPVALAVARTIDQAEATETTDDSRLIELCRTILAMPPAHSLDLDALAEAAHRYRLAHSRHRLHHSPGVTDGDLLAEAAALHRAFGCADTGDHGTRVLTNTVIRVLSCSLDPLSPLDGDPYHAWVFVPAWQTRRALLVPGRQFLAASPADTHHGLAGQHFIGDVWEPDGWAPSGEQVRFDSLRYAEPPQWPDH